MKKLKEILYLLAMSRYEIKPWGDTHFIATKWVSGKGYNARIIFNEKGIMTVHNIKKEDLDTMLPNLYIDKDGIESYF